MITYKDRTFCVRGAGCTCDPSRRLTDKVRADAEKWWGKPGAPIAYAILCPDPEPQEPSR